MQNDQLTYIEQFSLQTMQCLKCYKSHGYQLAQQQQQQHWCQQHTAMTDACEDAYTHLERSSISGVHLKARGLAGPCTDGGTASPGQVLLLLWLWLLPRSAVEWTC
jgi:hypothetical protein